MPLHHAIASLRFQPLIPAWLLIALALVAVLGVAMALLRRARGAWLRLLAFAVLLFWLAGPSLVEETRQGLPDIALLVVDRTASMRIGNRMELAERAREAVQQAASRLGGLDLRTVEVPDTPGHGTQLFAAINRALADVPHARLSAVIAITDGEVHDVPKLTAHGAPWGDAPLHVLIPAKGEEIERRIHIVEAPSFGVVGHSVGLRYMVEDLGVAHPSATARVTIRRDGEPPLTESVPVGQMQALEIPITHAGPSFVELHVEPLPGQAASLNNRAIVTINGVRDRLRVLLVSGEPYPGERTWRRLMKSDPSVDLVHFTILRPPEKDDLTPLNELALIAFPVNELFQLKIRQFDLIILDRFQNRGILPAAYLHNIADYVRGGGALLVSAGPEFASIASLAATSLGEVLPANPADLEDGTVVGPFRPLVTALGARHPVTANLPGWQKDGAPHWGPWYRHEAVTDVHGEMVMQAEDGQPLLILDRVGKGRIALLLSDQIWLWSRGHQGGGPQGELLRRLIHWLMKEPELEENTLTARIQGERLVITERTLQDRPLAAVTITDPNGARRQQTLNPTGPGESEASVPATIPGVWQVSDGTRSAFAAVGTANPLELQDLRATASKLAPVVRATDGSVHWLDPNGAPELRTVDRIGTRSGANWIGLPRTDGYVVTGVAVLPLLPGWVALPLMLGFVLLAWRREGR